MLAEIREQLINDLKTGSDGATVPTTLPVHAPYPGRVVAPCYVVGMKPGPYILKGQVFQSFEVIMTVTILVPKSDDYLNTLESMVEYVLANTVDWGMQGVDTPTALTESGMEMIGTVVSLSKQMKF